MAIFQHIKLAVIISLIATSCKAQDFKYQPVPSQYLPQTNQQYISEAQQLQKSAIDLTTYLPSGYVTDGSVDYTRQLQKGIDSNRISIMPDFPVLTNGIHLRSGNTLIFQDNSWLWMLPSNKETYQIIGLDNVHDVNLFFPKIKGERQQHIGSKGEWGFGIGVVGAENIRIIDPIITDCWGDGIYINNAAKSKNSLIERTDSIFISGARLDNNRRNGISVIDGNNITIQNSTISNTNGTLPMSGIDIEPNNGLGELNNITLNNVITFNNNKYGILISLAFFVNSREKNVNLTVKNCTDDGSDYGMGFVFDWPKKKDSINAFGNINIINPNWKNSKSGDVKLPFYTETNNIKLTIQHPQIFMKNKLLKSPLKMDNADKSKNIIFIQ